MRGSDVPSPFGPLKRKKDTRETDEPTPSFSHFQIKNPVKIRPVERAECFLVPSYSAPPPPATLDKTKKKCGEREESCPLRLLATKKKACVERGEAPNHSSYPQLVIPTLLCCSSRRGESAARSKLNWGGTRHRYLSYNLLIE